MLKSFREGLAKRAGEWTANLILAGVVAGGTLTAWLAAPAVNVKLTHLQVVACVSALLVLLAATSWSSRALILRRRPKFHLTQHGHRNMWGTVEQKDGSLNTSIAAELVAKNLTTEPVYLVTSRLVRPRIGGEVLMEHVHLDGGSPAVLPPREPAHVSVFLHIRGVLDRPRSGDEIAAVLGISDDEGHEQRVHVRLRLHQPPSKIPVPATSVIG
jgi:hypothetical protein